MILRGYQNCCLPIEDVDQNFFLALWMKLTTAQPLSFLTNPNMLPPATAFTHLMSLPVCTFVTCCALYGNYLPCWTCSVLPCTPHCHVTDRDGDIVIPFPNTHMHGCMHTHTHMHAHTHSHHVHACLWMHMLLCTTTFTHPHTFTHTDLGQGYTTTPKHANGP